MYPSLAYHFVSHHAAYRQSWLERKSGRNVCEVGGVFDQILQPPLSGDSGSGVNNEGKILSLGQLEQRALSRGQVGDVAGAGELESDVLGCLKLT